MKINIVLSPIYLSGLLAILLLFSGEREIIIAESIPVALNCVRTVLNVRGYSVFKVDTERRVVTTGFRWVSPEELGRIAITKMGGGQIRWTKGLYQLTFTLSQADEGETRIRVSAKILGASVSPLLMRPSNWSPLPSTGIIENDILEALVKQCRVDL